MSTTTAEAPKKNRTVIDQHGQSYELTGRIGEGGQGVVCKTNFPNVLIKVSRATTDEKRASWTNTIRALMRQPLEGLPIAHPLALITRPQPGYVMELMDGLTPLTELMQVATDALMSDDGLSGYVQTGGLLRRLRILARLARVLAELHGRGLAYGDLSPANIFVSKSVEYAEVWLIDADNISSQSRDGQQGVYTPDYGAPEILRGESGINTLTDSWSFAVIAYSLLTLAHPLKGDAVLDGEPEHEDAALHGELPWVDHPEDRSNALSVGLPREFTLNKPLRALFERCFNAGINNPSERPSLSEWADAFESATGHCDECESCGNTFFYRSKSICSFCDYEQKQALSILLSEHLYSEPSAIWDDLDCETKNALGNDLSAKEWGSNDIPPDVKKLIMDQCWSRTGRLLVVTNRPIELYINDSGSIEKNPKTLLCTIRITDSGEPEISPTGTVPVYLTRSGGQPRLVKNLFVFRNDKKTGQSGELHLGDSSRDRVVWRFKW